MSKIIDWLNNANGTFFNPDNAYGYQCVDVVDAFAVHLYGNWVNTIRPGNAWQLYDRANGEYFEKLPAGAAVRPGDIPVYAARPWNGNFGHIGVVKASFGNGWDMVEQNGLDGTKPAKVTRYTNRNDVIGILRPKGFEEGGDMPLNKDQVRDYYSVIADKTATPQEEADWAGKDPIAAFYGIKDSVPGSEASKARVANAEAAQYARLKPEDVNMLYTQLTGRPATEQEIKDWQGQYWPVAYSGIYGSVPAAEYRKKLTQAGFDPVKQAEATSLIDKLKALLGIK